MYCLPGLDQPTSGQVSFNGTDLAGRSRKALAEMRRGELGFVFQSYNLVPTLTAYENVALPYLLSGKKPPRERLVAIMNEVGLNIASTPKFPQCPAVSNSGPLWRGSWRSSPRLSSPMNQPVRWIHAQANW